MKIFKKVTSIFNLKCFFKKRQHSQKDKLVPEIKSLLFDNYLGAMNDSRNNSRL